MFTKDDTYRFKGGRIGVLLIHGLGGTPLELRYVANGLARQGYSVVCPQLAGHCSGEDGLKAATWQDWYKSCEDALDELRESCDFVVVGGHSTGALLAMMLSAKRPNDVQAMTLMAPTLWANGWAIPWYAHFFRLVRYKWFANLIKFPDLEPYGIKDDRIRAFFMQALMDPDSSQSIYTPGGAVLEHRWLGQAIMPLLEQIKQPTLILHPREDDIADINNAFFLQRKFAGRVDVSVLEDSYHNCTLDRQRHVVVQRSAGFIESVLGESEQVQERAKLRERARASLRAQPVAVAA